MTDNSGVPGATWVGGSPSPYAHPPLYLNERERQLVVSVLRYVDGACAFAGQDGGPFHLMLGGWMQSDIAALLKRLSPEAT